MFNVELILTNDCNLSCPYCYVKQNPKSLTLDAFKASIPKIHKYMKMSSQDGYSISLFGGEPLLKFDLIKQIVNILNKDKFCKEIVLISNLTLLNERIRDYLLINNVGVSFSFDGITSEVSRPLKNKKSILSVYEHKKELILSLTQGCKAMVYPQNCLSMLDNLKYLHQFGFKSVDLSLVRDDIWTERDVENFKSCIHSVYEYYQKYHLQGGFFNLFRSDIESVRKFGRKRGFCCFAGVNGCCVTVDGEIYACERFSANNKFNYELMDNPFKFKSKFDPSSYDKCKNCELEYFCNAGCLYSQIQNGNQPLDCICELYKAIYNEIKHEW